MSSPHTWPSTVAGGGGCLLSWRQTNLDGDGAAPFEDEVAALEVLIGGAAQLDVHLLRAGGHNAQSIRECKHKHHMTQCNATPHHATPPYFRAEGLADLVS